MTLDTDVRATPRARRVKGKAEQSRQGQNPRGRILGQAFTTNHHHRRQTPAPPVAKRCDGGGGCGASCSRASWPRRAVNGCVVSITCRLACAIPEGWAISQSQARDKTRRGGRWRARKAKVSLCRWEGGWERAYLAQPFIPRRCRPTTRLRLGNGLEALIGS